VGGEGARAIHVFSNRPTRENHYEIQTIGPRGTHQWGNAHFQKKIYGRRNAEGERFRGETATSSVHIHKYDGERTETWPPPGKKKRLCFNFGDFVEGWGGGVRAIGGRNGMTARQWGAVAAKPIPRLGSAAKRHRQTRNIYGERLVAGDGKNPRLWC